MSSSELSNALNPYVVQTRSRSLNTSYSSNLQPVVQPPQQHVPHRSELELAISEPVPAPPPRDVSVRPRNPAQSPGTHAVHELLRMLAATKEAQEIERKRRLAWEQEQEAKYTQRQAEMERQMLEMRQEIQSLKGTTGPNVNMSPGNDRAQVTTNQAQTHTLPTAIQQPSPQPSQSPVPVSSRSQTRHTFIQGSSSRPIQQRPTSPDDVIMQPSSPQFIAMDGLQTHRDSLAANSRKRPTPDIDSNEDDDTSSSSSFEGSSPPRATKRRNTGRCLTIQHAIRAHVLRAMRIDSDKQLPDSHIEGTPLPLSEPIRFVWDKTPKQSVHNGRMKTRFIADLKAHRRLYKHVPDRDFSKKNLDSAFDQAFVTFRQKFKVQRDESAALLLKQKEDGKALKARRLARKKTKLSNRSDTRNRIEAFEHITFDGALQLECMSSEESAPEDESSPSSRPCTVYRIRGLPWRSSRLRNFYTTLDEGDQADKSLQPRRGVGRRERTLGPDKDGFFIPPKGVASWMISRRWLNSLQRTNPELVELMKDIVVDPSGFDWNLFPGLGGEDSDDDAAAAAGDQLEFDGIHFGHGLGFMQPQYIQHCATNTITSSLHNALAPV